MQERSKSTVSASLLYQRIMEYILITQTFFLHACIFIGAVFIGIARYSRSAPPDLTLLMALWSVGLLLHGLITYRAEHSPQKTIRQQQDGVLKTTLVSVAVNAVMWGMWSLATDAQDATPWHLSVFLAFTAMAISALIIGKRALYAHWLRTYLRDHPGILEETKQKREYVPEVRLRLTEDGELFDYLEDTDKPNLYGRSAERDT